MQDISQVSTEPYERCVELNRDGPHRFSHFVEGLATGGFGGYKISIASNMPW